MTKSLIGAAWLILSTSALAVEPISTPNGKQLHETHCMGCHDTGVYTRPNHSVRSLDDLKHQLEACTHMAKQNFSPAQTQSLIDYLDKNFYRFRK